MLPGNRWRIEFPSLQVNALLGVWLLALGLGWLMVCSASISVSEAYTGSPWYFALRHLVYLVIAAVTVAGIVCVPIQFWQKISGVLLLLAVMGLIVVLIPGLGHQVNGSRR